MGDALAAIYFENSSIRQPKFRRFGPKVTAWVRLRSVESAIVFVRHDDGSWNAFSAKASRLAMRAYPLAA
jgi:hypothetical protein